MFVLGTMFFILKGVKKMIFIGQYRKWEQESLKNPVVIYQCTGVVENSEGEVVIDFTGIGGNEHDGDFSVRNINEFESYKVLTDTGALIYSYETPTVDNEELVTVPKSELERLYLNDHTLDALACGEVDNWSYYSDALRDYLNFMGVEYSGDFNDDYEKLVEESMNKLLKQQGTK